MPEWVRKFDDRIDVRPPLSDEQLTRIPARRGVVALLAEEDSPILMMTAGDVRSRVRTRLREPAEDVRRKSADLRQITRAIAWKLTSSHFETDLRFLELAEPIWPGRYPSMLGWKQAWFAHVEPAEEVPHFAATRRVFERIGRYVGPFAGERDARHFIEAVQDGFELCRLPRCLRQAPNAKRCTYGQMGRCLSPCDGTIRLDDYRRVVASAADFAAGRREEFRRRLQAEMRTAAEGLKFEQAARIKSRLERLAELEGPRYRHARTAEEFQYVLIQRGEGRSGAKVFLVDRGRVAEPAPLRYPLQAEELTGVLGMMRQLVSRPYRCREADRWVIGLVAGYLLSNEKRPSTGSLRVRASGSRTGRREPVEPRRGLIVRWDADLEAAELAARIEEAREALSLRPPRKKAKGPSEAPGPDGAR